MKEKSVWLPSFRCGVNMPNRNHGRAGQANERRAYVSTSSLWHSSPQLCKSPLLSRLRCRNVITKTQ
jgi:hypothetical protein